MEASKKIIKLMAQFIAIIAILLIADTLYTFFRGSSANNASISFTESRITFSDSSGEDVVILYSDIVSIELLEAPDYGEPTDGLISNNIRIGTWKSDELGTYISHTATNIKSCLLIQTSDYVYAVNYESEKTTALLIEELNKYR